MKIIGYERSFGKLPVVILFIVISSIGWSKNKSVLLWKKKIVRSKN